MLHNLSTNDRSSCHPHGESSTLKDFQPTPKDLQPSIPRTFNSQLQEPKPSTLKIIELSPYWPDHLSTTDHRVKGTTEGVKIGITDLHVGPDES